MSTEPTDPTPSPEASAPLPNPVCSVKRGRPSKGSTTAVNFRLNSDAADTLTVLAARHGFTKTAFVEEILHMPMLSLGVTWREKGLIEAEPEKVVFCTQVLSAGKVVAVAYGDTAAESQRIAGYCVTHLR